MKNKKTFKRGYTALVGLLLVFFAVSCDKSFLDDNSNSGYALKPITNLSDMQSALNGAYSTIQDYRAFGRSALVIPDLVADNAFISKSSAGRFIQFYNLDWLYDDDDIENLWVYLYKIVQRANYVIVDDKIDLSKSPESLKKLHNQYLGEAYAIRGMAHFTLANFFLASPHTGQDTPGIPYVKTLVDPKNPTDFDTPRLSLSATYKSIEKDFTKALELLDKGDKTETGHQKQKVYLGPAAVDLLLSRLYLYEQQYEKVSEYADKAIALVHMVKKKEYADYWQKENADVETVFEIELNSSDNDDSNSYAGIINKKVSYGSELAYDALVQAMSQGDVRRELFKKVPADEKRFDNPPGWYVKKYTSPTVNIKLLRISEAYLNKIEAEFKSDNKAAAKQDLIGFAEQRDDEDYSSLSGSGLLTAILKERRFELCFEGYRLFDLRRNKLGIHRGANAFTSTRNVYFPSKLYYLPIPKIQMTAPNNKVTQNPGY